MSNLENYIQNLKEYFNKNPDFTETEKIMYVYIDLGKRFKFDQDFYFAGSKERKRIYEHSNFFDYLEESFEKNKIICKSSSKICEHILKSLGINCITLTDESDLRKYPHVYNIIIPKDGSESYSIDLQNDIENIEFHAFTRNFGLSIMNGKSFVIPVKEQKRIHEKIGYVSEKNPYMDSYIYLFKQDLGMFETFNEKIDFVLQNIDPEKLDGINYWERRWKHEKFIEALFPAEELQNKLHTVEIYKKIGDKKKFYNAYFVMEKQKPIIYIYSEDDFKYNKISVEEFAKMEQEKGFNCTQEQRIPGINKAKRKLRDSERKDIERQ